MTVASTAGPARLPPRESAGPSLPEHGQGRLVRRSTTGLCRLAPVPAHASAGRTPPFLRWPGHVPIAIVVEPEPIETIARRGGHADRPAAPQRRSMHRSSGRVVPPVGASRPHTLL